MPEVMITIDTTVTEQPRIHSAMVKSTEGQHDSVEEVIEAAKKVRDFVAEFHKPPAKEE